MDIPQINFNEYKFDSTPYTIPVNMVSQQIQDKSIEVDSDSKTKLKQLDTQINEKMEEISQIDEAMKKVRAENLKLQLELKSLKKEEECLSSTHSDLKEGEIESHIFWFLYFNCNYFILILVLKNMCKVTFVQNNEEFRAITQKIQMSLGFKLKLQQCHDNQHLWVATFLFDVSSELETNHCVVIGFNTQDESFTCPYNQFKYTNLKKNWHLNIYIFLFIVVRDIKPKPARFTEMVHFLAKTNDVTGLLYNCWKYFSSIPSQH